jgi:hypothetical protein
MIMVKLKVWNFVVFGGDLVLCPIRRCYLLSLRRSCTDNRDQVSATDMHGHTVDVRMKSEWANKMKACCPNQFLVSDLGVRHRPRSFRLSFTSVRSPRLLMLPWFSHILYGV